MGCLTQVIVSCDSCVDVSGNIYLFDIWIGFYVYFMKCSREVVFIVRFEVFLKVCEYEIYENFVKISSIYKSRIMYVRVVIKVALQSFIMNRFISVLVSHRIVANTYDNDSQHSEYLQYFITIGGLKQRNNMHPVLSFDHNYF